MITYSVKFFGINLVLSVSVFYNFYRSRTAFVLTLSQETVKVNFSHTPFVRFSVFFDVFVILY